MINTRSYCLTPLFLAVVTLLLSRPTASDRNGGFELHKPFRCPQAVQAVGLHTRQFGVVGIVDGKGLALPFPSSPFCSPSLLRDCLLTTHAYLAQ